MQAATGIAGFPVAVAAWTKVASVGPGYIWSAVPPSANPAREMSSAVKGVKGVIWPAVGERF